MKSPELPYADTLKCVQCGYCLPACPTYQTTGNETQSPRGRINLVRLVAEGKISDESLLEGPIDLCLGCRACEEACPVGVPYGEILEQTRYLLREHSTKRGLGQRVQTAIYRHLLPDKGRLNLLGDFIWFYQQTIGRWRLMNRLLPLREFVEIMPKIEGPIVRRRKESKESIHARQGNKKVMFFRGCIMDVMFSSINRQTTELLRHLGWSPIVPEEQTCCGALHAHAGDLEFSKELAKKNIMAFEASGARVIVHNAGGCGAMLYEYKHLFEGDSEWAERARKFSDSVQDISQIVASSEQGKFAKAVDAVVTYQCSCHLNHVEKVKSEPVQVIKNLPGVTYKQLPNGTSCCGSAGIYNLVHRKEADAILQAKMSDVKKVNAQVLVTSNPGCYLQMKLGIHQAGLSKQTRVVHLVELLAEASGTAD